MIMVLSLKLEVQASDRVLVTNSQTKEQIGVTLSFLQKVVKNSSSLLTLVQYGHYELILEADRYWNGIKKFQPGKEIEIIREIELEQETVRNNLRSAVRQKMREETAAKQQHWKTIAAYNKAQKQWRNDGYQIILRCQQSYNKALIALKYADYCLESDLRYQDAEEINYTNASDSELFDISPEEQITILQRENRLLRQKIKELEAKCINY